MSACDRFLLTVVTLLCASPLNAQDFPSGRGGKARTET